MKLPALLLWSLLGIGTLLTASCKRQRLARPTPPPRADSTAVVTLPARDSVTVENDRDEKVDVAEIDFRYLVSRSKISFRSKDQKIDNANVNIRIKKDSVIWMNVSLLGISGARALITRDQVTVIDLVHKEYSQFDYATLSRRYGIELSFDLLQSIIVGNVPLRKNPRKISKDPDYFIIRQEADQVLVDNYIGKQDRKLRKLKAVELRTNNTLNLTFDNFAVLNDMLFPYSSLITLDLQSGTDRQSYQTVIEIRHLKVDLTDEPQSFPFSIPAKYERKN